MLYKQSQHKTCPSTDIVQITILQLIIVYLLYTFFSGQPTESIPSTSRGITCYESDISSEKECLFGSDFSDLDPTYVPDSDENIQKDKDSECDMINPEEYQGDNDTNDDVIAFILENLLDRVWISVKPLKRRKRALPTEWKRNINKARKADGLSYITKGVIRTAKLPKPIQCDKCIYKCTQKFSPEERNVLCRNFYNMNFIARKNFILSRLKIQPVKTRKVQKTSNKKDRTFSKKYFFKKNNEENQVCLNFFKATLCISVDVITDAVNKVDSTGVYNNDDQRGKKEPPNKTKPEDVAFVQHHIEAFPVMESHYCRKDSKKKYLAPDIKSINNMYQLYIKTCKESERVPVSSFIYREIFNSKYNLSFFHPKKDLCNICTRYGKSDLKEDLEEDYQEHLQRKKICQEEKDADKIRANTDNSFMSITMDLQAVLQMPSGGESILYYMRKLVLYNFTIYEAKLPNNAYCLCWSELNGKKGSSEIGTCLYYYLSKELPPTIKEISIFSDTCSGQNRNQYISTLLLWAVQKIEHLDVIEQKFLESGHSHMEVDSMHAAIEAASKNKTINSVSEWKNVFKAARRKRTKTITKGEIKEKIEIDKYKVTEFKFNEMLDLKSLGVAIMKNKNKDNMNETVNWLKIKRMRYVKGDLKIYFTYDMSDNFRSINVLKMPVNTLKTRAKRNSNPPSVNVQLPEEIELLYSSQLPISIAKKKDLLNMCEKQIIPEELHAWIRDMKTYTKPPAFESDGE